LREPKVRMKPRVVTAQQSSTSVSIIRRLADSEAIKLGFTSSGGDEAFNLARQLVPLFKEAVWKVINEASLSNIMDMQLSGVMIMARVPENTDMSKPVSISLTPTLDTLRAAFAAIGI